MATQHNIGELIHGGVTPSVEDQTHLQSLGGFAAGLYGRLLGGQSAHLDSALALWSGEVASRLSGMTGARWERGLGLSELLLGHGLTSFWDVARGGFAEGYDALSPDFAQLQLFEEGIAGAADEVSSPRQPPRRGSLFGARTSPRARSAQKTARAQQPLSAEPRLWRDGTAASPMVLQALAAGGLYLEDQLGPPSGKQSFTEPTYSVAASGGGAPKTHSRSLGQRRSADGSGGPSGSPRRSVRGVSLDGLWLDDRTPALTAALEHRGQAAEARASRMLQLGHPQGAAVAAAGVDRGRGMGSRPVFGFYDAVDTTFVTLPGAREADSLANPNVTGPAVSARREAAVRARGPVPVVQASGARGQVAQVKPATQPAFVRLADVVAPAQSVQAMSRGMLGAQRAGAESGAVSAWLAPQIVYSPAGTPQPRVQRGGLMEPRMQLIATGPQSSSQRGAAAPGDGGTNVGPQGVTNLRFPAAPSAGAAVSTPGSDQVLSERVGALGTAGPRTGWGLDGPGAQGAALANSLTILGDASPRTSWRLAADGGSDLPLGATVSRHEAFAWAHEASVRSEASSERFAPVGSGLRAAQIAGQTSTGAMAGRSAWASQADGLVWVALAAPQSVDSNPTLGLSAVPEGRAAAMMPASLALSAGVGVGRMGRVTQFGMDAGNLAAPQRRHAAVSERNSLAISAQDIPLAGSFAGARALAARAGLGGEFGLGARWGAETFGRSPWSAQLEQVVAAGGYARIPDGRVFATLSGESFVAPQDSDASAASGGAQRTRRSRSDSRGLAQRARVLSSQAERPSLGRSMEHVNRDVAATRGFDGGISTSLNVQLAAARAALLRPVATGREARAVASVLGGAWLGGAGGAQAAGALAPALSEQLARRGTFGGGIPLGRQESAAGWLQEALAQGESSAVVRAFRQAGWTEPELSLLRLGGGVDAGVNSALSPEADGASGGSVGARIGSGASSAAPSAKAVSGASAREWARLDRMSRSMARIGLGAEAMGAAPAVMASGTTAMAAARMGAVNWLPLLAGADSGYFGALAPTTSRSDAYRSLGDGIGDLVKIAALSLADGADQEVASVARREQLVRALAASQQLGRAHEVASEERGMRRLGTSMNAGAGEATAVDGERVQPISSGIRALSDRSPERALLTPERRLNLEDRVAEALALSVVGPAGARRVLGRGGSAARDAGRATAEGATQAGGRRAASDTQRIAAIVNEGKAPSALRAAEGEAGAMAWLGRLAGGRALPRGAERLLASDGTWTLGATATQDAEFIRGVVDSQRAGYQAMGGAGSLVALGSLGGEAVAETLGARAATAEERRFGGSMELNRVLAPEGMLPGLRSSALSRAMAALGQGQGGQQALLRTLQQAGIDLSASRSALSVAKAVAGAQAGRAQDGVSGGDALGVSPGARDSSAWSRLAERAPEQALVSMLAEAGGIDARTERALAGNGSSARRMRAGLLSTVLRGTERAEIAAVMERAVGRDFAFAWLRRVDGSRSGLDLGMGEARQEMTKTFGSAELKSSELAGASPIREASLVHNAAREQGDRTGLRRVADATVTSRAGSARPQRGAADALRRTDWSYVNTGSARATPHADLGKLAATLAGTAGTSYRAPMPLVAPAAKAVAQTALRSAKSDSRAVQSAPRAESASSPSKGGGEAKMSEEAVEMLAVEMAHRVGRLMSLTKERIGIWAG